MALIERGDLIAKLHKIPGYLDEDHETLIPLREVRKLIDLMPTVDSEPTYPTWMEWLCTIGLCEADGKGYRIRVEEFNKPMDPGIAEKLGLEPKEG